MPINVAVPQDGVSPSKADIRANFLAINNKIGRVPEAFGIYPAGNLLCTTDSSDGFTTASDGVEPLHAGARPLGHHKPHAIVVSSNTSLTTQGHEGCLLVCRNSTGIVLQLEKNASDTVGVQDLFSCTILRPSASGSVQITSSTLTNDHPDGHTRIG